MASYLQSFFTDTAGGKDQDTGRWIHVPHRLFRKYVPVLFGYGVGTPAIMNMDKLAYQNEEFSHLWHLPLRDGLLPARLTADTKAALLASLGVSPFVCAIDKAIIKNASGGGTIASSLARDARTIARKPHWFFGSKEFLAIYAVYFATYWVANMSASYESSYIRMNIVDVDRNLRSLDGRLPARLNAATTTKQTDERDYTKEDLLESGMGRRSYRNMFNLMSMRDAAQAHAAPISSLALRWGAREEGAPRDAPGDAPAAAPSAAPSAADELELTEMRALIERETQAWRAEDATREEKRSKLPAGAWQPAAGSLDTAGHYSEGNTAERDAALSLAEMLKPAWDDAARGDAALPAISQMMSSAEFSEQAGVYRALLHRHVDEVLLPLTRAPTFDRPGANPYPLLATSITNIFMCVGKDRLFVLWLGSGPVRAVPWSSLGLFTFRDFLTVWSSFQLTPHLASFFATSDNEFVATKSKMLGQILGPVSIQIVSTPIHLYGIALYNMSEPYHTWKMRLKQVATGYVPAMLARMSRILPAFGIGGIGNSYLRDYFREEAHVGRSME